MIRPLLYLAFLVIQAIFNFSMAGGPIAVAGANGAKAVTYPDPNIILNVENGDLGTTSNATAVTLMQDAINLWNNVDTASINLSIDQTQIALDIDDTNFETYLPNLARTNFNEDDNLNPVVFDSDGKIIDLLFGVSQSGLVLGFAESIINTETGDFIEGYVVINGNAAVTDLKSTIAHEIGHFIGLDHTQVNIDNEESFQSLPFFCFTTDADNYPLMYPVACRVTDTLHPDDVSAVSALYPSAEINNNYGTLEGIFVDAAARPILGANIWVEDTSNGDAYSIVSDYLTQGTGAYRLSLPAGTYTLHANSINPEFTAGSGVGPYSTSSTDISFISPHPITEVTYFGNAEAGDELITIVAGQTVSVSFSIIGAEVATPGTSSDNNDSIADLFGFASPLTLIMLTGIVIFIRRMTTA